MKIQNRIMRKIFIITIMVAMISISMSRTKMCFASPSGNTTAYCAGTDYGDGVNTTYAALDAEYNYQLMGLTTYSDITPTLGSMNSSHSDGTKYLASGIVFLDGHGTPSKMYFNYQGRGGNYAVGVTKGSANVIESGCYLYGLGGYSLSDVALYVFAGCRTADGTDSIAEWVVDNGAKTSIGWTDDVNTSSFTEWLYRFNDAIRAGSTVMAACSIADSYSYVDVDVYDHVMYGYYYTNPYTLINPSGVLLASETGRPSTVTFDNVTEDNAEEKIETYLSERFGVDALSFIVSKKGTYSKVYDCSFSYKNVLTNYTMTFILENGMLVGYDNTNNVELSRVKNIIENFHQKYNDRQVIDAKEKLVREITESVDGNITSFEQYLYFDVEDEGIYIANKYVATDEYDLGFEECEMYSME